MRNVHFRYSGPETARKPSAINVQSSLKVPTFHHHFHPDPIHEIIKCINAGNECDLSHRLTALITGHYVDLMHIVTHRLLNIATFVSPHRPHTCRHARTCLPLACAEPSAKNGSRTTNQASPGEEEDDEMFTPSYG